MTSISSQDLNVGWFTE